MTDRQIGKSLVPAVTGWYRAHRRDLPWRRVEANGYPDAYRVWVSEVMLQQTRIDAVIPYYERFLAACPTVAALAACPDDALMKLWQGLGYYSRARNLLRGARMVVEKYGGALPDTIEALRTIPGIGDYTAGAIASLAFGLPEAAVDGNVLRVLSRVLASTADVRAAETKKQAQEYLRAIYPTGHDSADFTAGLMELGECVCLPAGSVKCDLCPLADVCRARARGIAQTLPVRSKNPPRRVEERTLLVPESGGRVAIRRRPPQGLLAGLWEFPNLSGYADESTVRAYLRDASPTSVVYAGDAKHIFSHVEWHMKLFRVTCRTPAGEWLWVSPADLIETYALPSAYRAALNLLKGDRT